MESHYCRVSEPRPFLNPGKAVRNQEQERKCLRRRTGTAQEDFPLPEAEEDHGDDDVKEPQRAKHNYLETEGQRHRKYNCRTDGIRLQPTVPVRLPQQPGNGGNTQALAMRAMLL